MKHTPTQLLIEMLRLHYEWNHFRTEMKETIFSFQSLDKELLILKWDNLWTSRGG